MSWGLLYTNELEWTTATEFRAPRTLHRGNIYSPPLGGHSFLDELKHHKTAVKVAGFYGLVTWVWMASLYYYFERDNMDDTYCVPGENKKVDGVGLLWCTWTTRARCAPDENVGSTSSIFLESR